MKKLLVVLLFGCTILSTKGQHSLDVGVFGGAGTYFGDMTKIEFNQSVHPAYGAFARWNFNPRYSLRLNAINGKIGANGEFEKGVWEFNKNVLDISLQFEFNYLKYILGDKQTPYSTYVFAGIGMQSYDSKIPPYVFIEPKGNYVFTPTIPFGLGFKLNLGKRIGLGIEGGLRKTFSDKLDNLDDPLSYMDNSQTPPVQVKYTDLFHNNDWTAYMGVHLVYKLIYGYRKWDLKTPNDKMIDWGIKNNIKRN